MAWTERHEATAAYTAPSGKKQSFIFDDAARETDLKTATYIFPDVDGAKVEPLGVGARKFSMACIFSGGDCEDEADAFEELLCERGVGTLEHPIYGEISCVPSGTIKRTDGWQSNLNESAVEITFAETIVDKIFPASSVEAGGKVSEAFDGFADASAAEFAKTLSVEDVNDELQLKSVVELQENSIFKDTQKFLQKTKGSTNDILQKVKNIRIDINRFIDDASEIVDNALDIARATIALARIPSQIAMNVLTKVEGYSSIIKSLVENVKKDPVGVNAVKNQFAMTQMAWGAMIASVCGGIGQEAAEAGAGDSAAFKSRQEAMQTIERLGEMFNDFADYQNVQVASNAFVDTGETYEGLLELVNATLGAVLENSFSLPTVKIVKLGRNRQILELLCELYGADGFERMDEFINDNKLTADEIVCIPMGREVAYYV